MFVDPWNPTLEELRRWAYDPQAEFPCQDWDLALPWTGHEDAYLEMIQDPDCSGGSFFLEIIYLMVGDVVRGGFKRKPRAGVEAFVEKGRGSEHPVVAKWYERSMDRLANPNLFRYEDWCAGGGTRGRLSNNRAEWTRKN